MTGFTRWHRNRPPWLIREQVTLAPHTEQDFSAPEWQNCLLVVEDGAVVLSCAAGALRLDQGAVFALTGLTAPVLRNPNPVRATICSARTAPFPQPERSVL